VLASLLLVAATVAVLLMFHLRAPALQTPPPDLSLRYNHSDGIFLVYEALIPAANPRPDAG